MKTNIRIGQNKQKKCTRKGPGNRDPFIHIIH